jgi:hypothetical protein
MSNKKALRKRFFVDPKVQGGLALRIALYWLVCLLTITLMLLCWRIITGPVRPFYTHLDDLWFFNGPAIVASLLLLPLVVVDIVRWSNRFAGPMLRLRRSMRALARGESVKPIEFRGNDFWCRKATPLRRPNKTSPSRRTKKSRSGRQPRSGQKPPVRKRALGL